MRLLCHNLIMCNAKDCTQNNYPLKIEIHQSKDSEQEFDEEFCKKLIPKFDWHALYKTITTLWKIKFPSQVSPQLLENEDFLKTFYNLVYNKHIIEGKLICENCKREYPISNGVPDLRVEEDEA